MYIYITSQLRPHRHRLRWFNELLNSEIADTSNYLEYQWFHSACDCVENLAYTK